MAPIRIQAQALRRQQAAPQLDAFGPFAIVPEEAPAAAEPKKSWRQSDVERAIGAAREAGIASYRVEIGPDGTISVIVGDPADTAAPAPYSDLLWGRGGTQP